MPECNWHLRRRVDKTSGDDQAFISAHVAEDDQERHYEALELILDIAQPESALWMPLPCCL